MKHISEFIDEAMREWFEERAAIREYDGQQSRDDAERFAMAEIRAKIDAGKVQK